MVKRTVKEKEIVDYLRGEGFKKVGVSEKKARWYKKASEPTPCLKTSRKGDAKK